MLRNFQKQTGVQELKVPTALQELQGPESEWALNTKPREQIEWAPARQVNGKPKCPA